MDSKCQYCSTGTIVIHSEGGTCLDCSRVDPGSYIEPSRVPTHGDHSYLREWPALQVERQLLGTLSEIDSRENFSEAVRVKVEKTFKVLREATPGNYHVNTLVIAAIFYATNISGTFFPLTRCLQYSDLPITISTLNQRLSRVLSKANLSYPIPELDTICQYIGSFLKLTPKSCDELLSFVREEKSALAGKQLYFRDEVIISAICVKTGRSSLQNISKFMHLSRQSIRRALRYMS